MPPELPENSSPDSVAVEMVVFSRQTHTDRGTFATTDRSLDVSFLPLFTGVMFCLTRGIMGCNIEEITFRSARK